MAQAIAFIRSLLFNICFFGWTLIVVVFCIPAVFMPKFAVFGVARLWGTGTQFLLKHIVNITYEIRGQEHLPKTPVIVACKHQSAWETTMIHMLVPGCAIILKRELTWIPLFGQLLLKAGSIKLHRSKGSRVMPQLIAQAKDRLAAGQHIFIFPEGTRRAVDAPLLLKTGVATLYRETNATVVPATHNAGYFWARRDFIKKPGKIVFQFLPPINPGLEREAFMKKLTKDIETASKKIIPSAPDAISNALDEKKTAPVRPKKLLFLVLLILISFGGYTVFWKNSAYHLEELAENYIASLSSKGVDIKYDSFSVTGFPFALQANFKKLRVTSKREGGCALSFQNKLMIRSSLFDHNRIQFKTKGAVLVSHDNYFLNAKVYMEIKRVAGEHTSEDHQNTYQFQLENLSLSDKTDMTHPLITIENVETSVSKRAGNAPSKEDRHTLDLVINTIRWEGPTPKGLGNLIQHAHLKGSLNELWDPYIYPKDSAADWFSKNGTLDLSNFELAWGPLKLDANGALTL
ncbi:MAG: 1-acyl-sn-glycerol-3-phosphate acyltransferase, partial [Alphaproteobacteria bacterium]|nr:1-acyl-sn-glycerol-3-phosphate acyltransferase [Alphaproteobacteria bacterium]